MSSEKIGFLHPDTMKIVTGQFAEKHTHTTGYGDIKLVVSDAMEPDQIFFFSVPEQIRLREVTLPNWKDEKPILLKTKRKKKCRTRKDKTGAKKRLRQHQKEVKLWKKREPFKYLPAWGWTPPLRNRSILATGIIV